jgi:hypothetical protein
MSLWSGSPNFVCVIFQRFSTITAFIGCGLTLLLAACQKKSQVSNTPVSTSETAVNDSRAAPTHAAPQGPAAAPATQPQASTPVQPVVVDPSADSAAVLAQLTQALRKFSFEHRRVPKSFSEVAAAGYVSGMPQAPPGKQFAVNVKRVEVVLVKK